MRTFTFGASLALAMLVACSAAPPDRVTDEEASPSTSALSASLPTPHAALPIAASKAFAPTATCPRMPKYPGAMSNWTNEPVMTGTVNVYYIWYGQWDPIDWTWSREQTLLTDFASGLGGSPYFAINQGYSGPTGAVSGAVHFGGYTTDYGSHGWNLPVGGTGAIVSDAITSGRLPSDPGGVYFVLTAKGVHEQSSNGAFCSSYCGYHGYESVNGVTIKYSFVGDPFACGDASCLEDCVSSTPNDAKDVDEMASVIAHELEETATDPTLRAWHDGAGEENADKCAWVYGPTYNAQNGAPANVRLNGHDWLIQENWVNAGTGYCGMGLPRAPLCTVSQQCGTGGVYVSCGAAPGDIVIERQTAAGVVTVASVPQATAQFSGAYVSDHPTGTGAVRYRACTVTPSGRYCTADTVLSLPAEACPPELYCKPPSHSCGDYCAPKGKLCQ